MNEYDKMFTRRIENLVRAGKLTSGEADLLLQIYTNSILRAFGAGVAGDTSILV